VSHSLKGHHAGFVSRLLAFGIDIAIISVSLVAIGWLLSTTQQLLRIDTAILSRPLRVILVAVGAFLYVAGYYTLFWTLNGQTPGKVLLGVRVVTLEGGQLSFKRSLVRFVGYILSALPLYAGFVWILIDNRRQGWHDKLASTFVIYSWEARLGDRVATKVRQRQANRQSSR
jgi:uncharacterized RDD family membrane protein YckC